MMHQNGICALCKYWRPGMTHPQEKQTCDAFPTEIPEEIWAGRVHHMESYKGDGGIQFTPAEDVTIEQVEEFLNIQREESPE